MDGSFSYIENLGARLNGERLGPDDLTADDELIFTSPYTGQESKVSYRGPFNGKAMIWTGMTQYAVEYKHLRRA